MTPQTPHAPWTGNAFDDVVDFEHLFRGQNRGGKDEPANCTDNQRRPRVDAVSAGRNRDQPGENAVGDANDVHDAVAHAHC